MNDIKIFENPTFGEIRTLTRNGEPWFVGKDVAEVLGYSNPRDALARHVDNEDKDTVVNPDGNRGNPNITIINESGLYSLILSSKLPTAKQFKRWVTSEVLPSIRKTGQYKARSESPESEKRAQAMALNAKTRAAKQLMTLWDKAGVSPAYQALAPGDYYAEDGIKLPAIALQSTKVTYDKTTIADKLGILSKSGKPHAQAVGAIIAQLNISESEREAVPYSRNGHDGVDYQYTESVIDKVDSWLTQHGQPAQIISGGKSYSIKYV
ncbi:MAG: Bro-N domain-containing protein [Butyricicoccaceae bacterium]